MHRAMDETAALRSSVYRWAYRVLGNHHDALDATQDVLVKCLRFGRGLAEGPGWVRRMTINHCIDELRKRRLRLTVPATASPGSRDDRTPTDVASSPARDLALEDEDVRWRVASALAALSEQQRAVVTAKVYDGETFESIARGMSLSLSTVKTHYIRGLRAMREALIDLKEDVR